VDKETGYLIEMNWWNYLYEHMRKWDYSIPNILELKYEDVFNNEIEAFKEIFAHFGFDRKHWEEALMIVDNQSFT
jgi:hypothetical protein